MKPFLFLCSLVFFTFLSTTALAQHYPGNEFFVAYSDSHGSGFLVSGAHNWTSHFGVEAQLSSHYKHNPKDDRFHIDVGPRVRIHDSDDKAAAFAHLMFGGSHISLTGVGDTSFSWILGGGAEYGFNPNWAGRLQIDLVRTHFFNTGQNTGRYSFGIVYRFH
jgi:hypothetical protein